MQSLNWGSGSCCVWTFIVGAPFESHQTKEKFHREWWWILSSDISDIKLFFFLLKLKKQKAGPNCGGTLRLISLSLCCCTSQATVQRQSYSFHCYLLAWEENSANDVQDIQQKAASCEAHWLLGFRPELFWFVTSETACWVNPSHTKKLSEENLSF